MANEPERQPTTTVRLLIFSGRPDPEWRPDVEMTKELFGRIRETVGREPIHPPPPGGLGYRGFLVQTLEGNGVPREVMVFRGVVTEQAGKRAAHWRDVTGLEGWLLEEARRQGHGEVLEAVGVGTNHQGLSE